MLNRNKVGVESLNERKAEGMKEEEKEKKERKRLK
jgi:hypothetical protein